VRRATTLGIAGLAAALLFGGCASPGGGRDRAELEHRLITLEKEATRARLEVARLQQRIAELERTRAAATSPKIAPERAEAAEPAESMEEAPLVQSRPRAAVEVDELPDPQSPGDATGATYDEGLRLLRDGRPAEAEEALQRFADANPDSNLADNAWFWIGESRLVRGDADGALAAYRTTIERYPEGNKIPDALLKLGHALEQRGDVTAAREAWGELVRRYPYTSAAEQARARLGER